MTWYTDGSKIGDKAGAGIWGDHGRTKIPIPLGRFVTVFQSEVVAILQCAQMLLRRKIRDKKITIYSDSQAALKALNAYQTESKLVWESMSLLNELGELNQLTISWVPGHAGIRGNEEADGTARMGSAVSPIGPEPQCAVADCIKKAEIGKWMQKKSQDWWKSSPGQRQAKQFIEERRPRFTKDLLNHRRNVVRIVVGLMTGHCRLNNHMNHLNLAKRSVCRFCQEEEETSEHVLCRCKNLAAVRFEKLGEEEPRADSYIKEPVSKLWSLVNTLKLDTVL